MKLFCSSHRNTNTIGESQLTCGQKSVGASSEDSIGQYKDKCNEFPARKSHGTILHYRKYNGKAWNRTCNHFVNPPNVTPKPVIK